MPVFTAPTAAFARHATRLLVLWLLAAVLPLQGAAVGVFTVTGPAHLHRPVEAVPLVLEDVRRWRPAAAGPRHVATALGHFHAGATAQRHYHGLDDGTVVHTGDNGPLSSPDGDETANPGASLAGVLAPIPGALTWAASGPPDARATHPPWRLSTGFIEPLERPPRRA